MSGVRDTKRMFADELEAMLVQTPLSKVRVGELCARCGVERCTFYYHFHDKYDLVAWMLDQDRHRATLGAKLYTRQLFVAGLSLIWKRREFYRRAFEEDSQNSIYRHHLQYCIDENEALLRWHLGVDTLPRGASFEACFFSQGNVGVLVAWLRGELDVTPDELTQILFNCMPPLLREAYEARAKEAADANQPQVG